MSPSRQIATLARQLAEAKAALAAKVEGRDLEDAIGNPFKFLARLSSEEAAVVLFIRFNIESMGQGLRALAVVLQLKEAPPSLRVVLDEFDNREEGKSRGRLRGQGSIAQRSLAIARSRAKVGAAAGGSDFERTFGDPFQFLADRIGERAAIAFFVRFNGSAIDTALRILGWMQVYQDSPPSIGDLLTEMAGERQLDFEQTPLVTGRIQ